MKLKYLGTAAAEAVPAPFCRCRVCERAREKGGRNVRTRSQALLDGRLLIDFPADTYLHALREGLRLYDISSCIITHCHSDHLYPGDLWCLISYAAHGKERPFNLYGTGAVLEMVKAQCEDLEQIIKEGGLRLHEIRPFEPFEAEGYRITALKADHGAPESVVYALEDPEGKAMLYAHDTGLLPGESLEYIKKSGIKFSLVSYDCTNGLLEHGERNHMGLNADIKLRDMLRELGAIGEGCVHVVNHFSHNGGGAGYDEMEPAARERDFLTSYDGLEVEF